MFSPTFILKCFNFHLRLILDSISVMMTGDHLKIKSVELFSPSSYSQVFTLTYQNLGVL